MCVEYVPGVQRLKGAGSTWGPWNERGSFFIFFLLTRGMCACRHRVAVEDACSAANAVEAVAAAAVAGGGAAAAAVGAGAGQRVGRRTPSF